VSWTSSEVIYNRWSYMTSGAGAVWEMSRILNTFLLYILTHPLYTEKLASEIARFMQTSASTPT